MTSALVEGQNFPPGFRLQSKKSEADDHESWTATSESTGEKVFVRVLIHVQPTNWEETTTTVDRLRGLVHENINSVSQYGSDNGLHFLLEPFVPNANQESNVPLNDFGILKQLIDAIQYAHNLGIHHGNLHPGNLLIDQSNKLTITGFGLQSNSKGSENYSNYSSPQALSSQSSSATDDVYSMGKIIFSALTDKQWHADVQLDTPLPNNIDEILGSMLSDRAFERAIDLTDLSDALATHFNRDSSAITSVDFSRQSSTLQTDNQPIQQPVLSRQTHAIPINNVLIGAGVVILLAILLFVLIPQQAPTAAPPTQTATTTTETPKTQAAAVAVGKPSIAPFEAAQLAFMQEQGEKVAREILRQQIELEDHGAHLWAADPFNEAIERLNAADDAFRDGQFETALEQFESVLTDLQEIFASLPDELARQLETGDAALLSGDEDAALQAFAIANSMERGNPEIQEKLLRAENLEQVLSLMRQGEMHEQDNALDDALKTFSNAKLLDSKWQAANDAVTRLRAAIRQRDFQQAMSKAFRAKASKDYLIARNSFSAAQSILPNSNEPADGLLQVDQAEKNDAINKHRENADRHLEHFSWREAIDEFNAALAITSSLEFAQIGFTKATTRLELDDRLLKYLSDPTLLQDNAGLSDATGALVDASKIKNGSATMLQQVNTLAKLVQTARIKIPVTIESDGRTLVTVRKHAQLDKFTSTVVHLIPGRWIIVGERSGYRNVREELTLIAGRPVPVIEIASTEKVR